MSGVADAAAGAGRDGAARARTAVLSLKLLFPAPCGDAFLAPRPFGFPSPTGLSDRISPVAGAATLPYLVSNALWEFAVRQAA